MNTNGSPTVRRLHTAVWTGGKMVVWGGVNILTYYNNGGRYDPVAYSWTAVTTNGAPAPRGLHTVVWTGSEMLVWGGYAGGSTQNDIFSYVPTRVLYLYQRP